MPLERQLIRRIDQDVPFYLSDDEYRRMVAVTTKPRDRMLIMTLWATGGRLSEVTILRRSDFDYRHLRLQNRKQKHRAEKLVYLASEYALALVEYCDALAIGPTDPLFPAKHSKRPISTRMGRKVFDQAARRAGVFKVKPDGQQVPAWPHLARHGAAVQLVRGGVPMKVVKEQLGHASLLTTERYLVFSQQDKAHFIQKAMGGS